jgi:hypothetical protein
MKELWAWLCLTAAGCIHSLSSSTPKQTTANNWHKMDFNEKVTGFISMVQHGCMSIMFNHPFAAWLMASKQYHTTQTYGFF